MQQVTEYVGHVGVAPALNRTEIAYLRGGSFLDETGRTARGKPSLWSPWLPSPDGRRLTCPLHDADLSPTAWLRYLIAELLKPGASRSYRKELKGFTFDHHLDGMVVGCRRGNGELFAITANNNRVRERVLRPAAAPYVEPREPRADARREAKVIPLRRYR